MTQDTLSNISQIRGTKTYPKIELDLIYLDSEVTFA